MAKLGSWLRWLWLRPQIKVFQINDCDWVAARNIQQAKFYYTEWTGACYEEEEQPARVSPSRMKNLIFNDEGKTRSFRAELNRRIITGAEFPQHFASTEY